eukprot:gene11924-8205_t
MSTSQETLKAAMREALEADGTMTHVKAELRAAIFKSLCDATTPAADTHTPGSAGLPFGIHPAAAALDGGGVPPAPPPPMGERVHPAPPPENYLINELIKEYLVFNGLEHTLAVFQLEARVPDSAVPRRVLASELKLRGAPAEIPLLYAMLNESRQAVDIYIYVCMYVAPLPSLERIVVDGAALLPVHPPKSLASSRKEEQPRMTSIASLSALLSFTCPTRIKTTTMKHRKPQYIYIYIYIYLLMSS